MKANTKQLLYLVLIINIFSLKAGEEPKYSDQEYFFIKKEHATEVVRLATSDGENGGMVVYTAGSTNEYRKRKISFKAIAYTLSKSGNLAYKNNLKFHNSCHGSSLCKGIICDCKMQTFSHPFIIAGRRPYQNGNGGLLNPILKTYCVKADEITHSEGKGACIEVSGVVAADGIAEYEFDNDYQGKPYAPYEYEMTLLETIILGALKERAVDRLLAHSDEAYFNYHADNRTINKHFYAFIECVKREYTGPINVNDKGERSPEDENLLKRHIPRTYNPSRGERWGVAEYSLNGRKSKQEITELEIKVEPYNK